MSHSPNSLNSSRMEAFSECLLSIAAPCGGERRADLRQQL